MLLFGSFLCALILIAASKPNTMGKSYSPQAIGIANANFQEDLTAFSVVTEQFHTATVNYSNNALSTEALENNYKKLREHFKKISFLVEYLDKEAYDKVLNGAPLPKLEPKVADFTILQPKGLQVIDELMGEANIDKAQLQEMSHTLKKDVLQLASFLSNRAFSDRQLFEATRQELVRLASLGITGFDTPGTLLGVADARVVLLTLQRYGDLYAEELSNVGQLKLLEEQKKVLEIGLKMTEKSDFETFDRLVFIKKVVNPLYKNFREIHLALDYETIDEVTRYPLAVRYASENIFSKDFLNPFYYVSIQNDSTFKQVSQLGKLLFYDPVLSSDTRMACASCHAPDKAFTDGLPTSLSNTGAPMQRNAMTLNYSVFASGFFHDLRAKRLEDQFEHVVLSEDEFNTNYPKIIEALSSSPTYASLFRESFPPDTSEIRPYQIDYALTAYIMGLNSFDTPVDSYFQGQIEELPENVVRGFNLFTGKAACATCHFIPTYSGLVPPLYIDSESEVLGVPAKATTPTHLDPDLGRADNGSTREVATFFEHAFKTPTLRNIEKTAPYMHNGVFETLEEVMAFYNEGGGAGRGAHVPNQTLSEAPLELTTEEIDAIIAFMKALSDKSVVEPPKALPRDFPSEQLNGRKLLQ
jgi:cytochrome c peroxidase